MTKTDELMALAQVWVDLHTVPGHGEDSRAALRYAIEQALSDSDRDYADMRRFQGLYIAADQELRALKAEPAPGPLTDAQVYEIWERAAQIDLSGRVNELIRTKDAQCVIRAVLKAQKEKT